MTLQYDSFDLTIERAERGRYCARADSLTGQASNLFRLPVSKLEVENFFLRLGRFMVLARRANTDRAFSVQELGAKLFESVFAGEVRTCFRTSVGHADRRGRGLRVQLRLRAPALAALPWEYFYDGGHDRFLGLSDKTPIVRYPEVLEPIRPLQIELPLSVLTLVASPEDSALLDSEREYENLSRAMSVLCKQGHVTLNRLEEPTLPGLQRELRRRQHHIFHFIGHGGFDSKTADGFLLFEDERRQSQRVGSKALGTLLHDHRCLCLAVLNACEGARGLRSDPFSGMAQGLVRQGVPAVIAMQSEISDEAAILFSKEFYSSLAAGFSVDAALAESRKAIFISANELEWGTPVLFMRSVDGHIFEITTAPPATIETSSPNVGASTDSAQWAMEELKDCEDTLYSCRILSQIPSLLETRLRLLRSLAADLLLKELLARRFLYNMSHEIAREVDVLLSTSSSLTNDLLRSVSEMTGADLEAVIRDDVEDAALLAAHILLASCRAGAKKPSSSLAWDLLKSDRPYQLHIAAEMLLTFDFGGNAEILADRLERLTHTVSDWLSAEAWVLLSQALKKADRGLYNRLFIVSHYQFLRFRPEAARPYIYPLLPLANEASPSTGDYEYLLATREQEASLAVIWTLSLKGADITQLASLNSHPVHLTATGRGQVLALCDAGLTIIERWRLCNAAVVADVIECLGWIRRQIEAGEGYRTTVSMHDPAYGVYEEPHLALFFRAFGYLAREHGAGNPSGVGGSAGLSQVPGGLAFAEAKEFLKEQWQQAVDHGNRGLIAGIAIGRGYLGEWKPIMNILSSGEPWLHAAAINVVRFWVREPAELGQLCRWISGELDGERGRQEQARETFESIRAEAQEKLAIWAMRDV